MALSDPRALRVYVVTSSAPSGRSHREIARAAIQGGATAIQLRAPELGDRALTSLAADLARACREAGVLFLVNDRPGVAAAVGADGAHVGQSDDPAGARAVVGPNAVLGISVASPQEARRARGFGADYLGVTVWPSATKADADPGGLERIDAVVRATDLPVVGIGGIDAGNASDVLAGGAIGVAVSSAIAEAVDPVAATRELAAAVRDALAEPGGPR
jgi:thiamine-phosphate diphosphorylase